MIHVNLDVNEEFYSTFKKFVKGFKEDIKIVDAYDEEYLDKVLSQALKEVKEGKTKEIKDIDNHDEVYGK